MAITHAKVINVIADGTNTSIVMPSDWNASHAGHDLALHTALFLATSSDIQTRQTSGIYQTSGCFQTSGVYLTSSAYQVSGVYQTSGCFQTSGVYLTSSAYQVSGVYEVVSNKGIASGYCGLDGSILVPTSSMGAGTAGATVFLRGDRQWATPTASATVAWTQVEVDFGNPSYFDRKSFVISDGSVNGSSKIGVTVSLDAPTGKQSDELEMDMLMATAGNCSAGAFNLVVGGNEGFLHDKFKLNYLVG